MDYTPEISEKQYGGALDLARRTGGLSKSHISPQNSIFIPGTVQYEHRKKQLCSVLGTVANITAWRGGSLVRVQRDADATHGRIGGGDRGRISGFSESSRRRLMYKLARVERGKLPVLVTLTYPDSYFTRLHDFKNWKRDIDALGKRILRKFGQAGLVWKMEVIDRKSGLHKGVEFPHFHLMIWGVELVLLRDFIPLAWYEVVATGDLKHFKAGTRVEQVRSDNGVRSYVSKYICKQFEDNKRYMGRWWGWIGKKNLPWSVADFMKLSDFEAELLICAMIKRMAIPDRHYLTLQFFCDASQVYSELEDWFYEGYVTWEDARKITGQDLRFQE